MINQDNFSDYLTVKDFLVSGESFKLLYDEEADLMMTSPQPATEDLPDYYKSEEYISHTDSGKGLMSFFYQVVKKYSLNKKVRFIARVNSGIGTLADIGAGTGAFLEVAKKRGWSVRGIEPNAKAREFAEAKGVSLGSSIKNLEGSQFDVVTLWHVLEHLPDLDEMVVRISNLVKPGGSLIIAVPNFKSYDARHYKNYWAAYDVPRHLWHFSRTAIKKTFNGKLDLVQTKPMIFDSFYVSLLSEKYKTGNSFSFKAFLIGMVSNIKGWRTKEYSSHIYHFRKPN